MLFKSQLVTQVSGSVGGITGSHNAGGMYFRARAIPTNPGTPQQVALRNIVTTLSNRWGDVLTAAERDAWDLYGDNVAMTNKLGDTIFLNGINHFVRSNTPLLQGGQTVVDTAPPIFNLGTFTEPSFAASEATQLVSITFTPADAWANEVGGFMLVWTSRPQSPTRIFFKGPYRFTNLVVGDPVPPVSPSAMVAPFPFVAGQVLHMRIRTTRADGRLSGQVRILATAGA